MRSRTQFRPTFDGVLEERVLMSHGGRPGDWHSRPPLHVQRAPLPQRIGPVGTLGDSFTDEYRFYPPDRPLARNWVELLSAARGIDFGPYSLRSRGEPRNQGYAYNWARSDATTVGMIQDQLPGLADQVARGAVRDVVILVGGNDFLEVLYGVAGGVITPEEGVALLPQAAARASVNFGTAVNTLLAASPEVRLVVSTINVDSLPVVLAGTAGVPQGGALLQATRASVDGYNAVIRQAAESPRVGLVDLAAVSDQLATAGVTSFPYGGTTIRLGVGNDFRSLFLADGVHSGTVSQGIIANLFVDAFNREFGTRVRPLSEQEVIGYARKAAHPAPHPFAFGRGAPARLAWGRGARG